FYSGRTPGLNALDPINIANAQSNGTTPTKNVLNQNQYGGSFGGPILPNNLFVFFNYSGFRKEEPLTGTTWQLRPGINGLGCPTAISAAIGLPGTGPGSMVSAAQCQAAKNYVLAHFLGVFPRYMRQDIELLKLDGQINQSNHVSVVTN